MLLPCMLILNLNQTNPPRRRAQPANVCHSRLHVPVDTERLSVQFSRRPQSRLSVLGGRRHHVLSAVAARRPTRRQALLSGAGRPMGGPGGGAQGRAAQLHTVPAHDAVPAQLVHQSGGAGDRRAVVSVRRRHVLW